jgi:hypothetical protein
MKVSPARCEAQAIGLDVFPYRRAESPVCALTHSNGEQFNLCEYHIECYWNFWANFREAIRDIGPVRSK